MRVKFQSLVFPTDAKHQACRKLFYRGDHGILNTKTEAEDREREREREREGSANVHFQPSKPSLSLGYAQRVDFTTYINACSWRKLQEYSNAKSVHFELEFAGGIRITFVGYTKTGLAVNRRVFAEETHRAKHRTTLKFDFPENNEQMLGFEITALDKTTILGGGYYLEINKKDLHPVVLSLATTTCHKEEFIKKNVQLIKEEILSSNEEIAKNLYLHVVDNGQTLGKKDIYGKHVFLHPNINAGGSGGFARGMIEFLHQKTKATHILLMDDDVLVLPESIKRTYNLLRIIKPELKDSIISGAMLYYERPSWQHEDIGTVSCGESGWCFRPLKEVVDHEKIQNNLTNEYGYPLVEGSYSAWWYCCIPRQLIEENGLPLPIFIRCDDMEYGLRCKASFLTLNGICIWHMGFAGKYNFAFDIYQQCRNMPIAQSVTGVMSLANPLIHIKTIFRKEILQFNYGGAEAVVRALEDYLKGPDFIKQPNGEKIMQANFKLNDQMTPLSQLEGGNLVNKLDAYADPEPTIFDRLIAKFTWNGQRWTPNFLRRDEVVPVSFNESIQLHRIILHDKLIAINPFDATGVVRIKDKQRFRQLYKRYKRAMRQYDRHHQEIAAAYAAERDHLVSEKFWQKYLGIKSKK